MSDLSLIVLRGAGLELHVTPLGAALVRLLAPDRQGALADVLLGYDSRERYAAGGTYFGSVVGRCANRIALGRFQLDGAQHQLACNNGPNALHGGPGGFHAREWAVEALLGEQGEPLPAGAGSPAGVRLAYTSPAGEEGYPGELRASVTYLLRADAGDGLGGAGRPALLTRFAATCDAPTLVNLAQHAYWNLGGHASGSVMGSHSLRLAAERYTPVSEDLIPTGRLEAVAGTPFDFSQPTLLGARAAEVPGGRGYDHSFVLGGDPGRGAAAPPAPPLLAAELRHAASGRVMRLFTDAPAVQLYAGGFLAAEAGKGGVTYCQHGGLCLETQIHPDAVNQPGFPSPVLRPGERYSHTMVTQLFAE